MRTLTYKTILFYFVLFTSDKICQNVFNMSAIVAHHASKTMSPFAAWRISQYWTPARLVASSADVKSAAVYKLPHAEVLPK